MAAHPEGSDTANAHIAPDVYGRRWGILAVLCTSLMIVIVGNTALNVAIPTLSRELDATTSQLQWMVDAYTLVFAGCCSPAGASATASAARAPSSSASWSSSAGSPSPPSPTAPRP